jgi:putative membrane protein
MIVAHDALHASLTRWTFEPITIVLLVATTALYFAGVRAIWMRAGRGSGISQWQAAAYAGGVVTLAVALVSPLAWLSEVLFSAHMTQHEILMLVSAPLLVISQPVVGYLWAFPSRHRARVAAAFRGPAVTPAWHVLTGPLAVFVVHAAALWVWHIPAMYEAALDNQAVHTVEHLCFLLTAALFWWGMVHGRYGRSGYGVAVLYVFLTGMHSTLLGALMTLSGHVWYPSYLASATEWRVDAFADQQLAGLIMWVPSGVVFIVLGLALLSAWIGESERRARLSRTAALVDAGRTQA